MAQIFSYILHKDGVVDDTALELAAAAKKIDAGATPNAIVVGAGDSLDAVCNEMAASYGEVWKVANDAITYPDAEMIRKLLVNILPADSIVLFAHEHLGMDLAPGLSVKMDSAFVSDVVDVEGADGATLKLVRQEFGGAVSAHVSCDASQGAVMTMRPGAFAADESKAASGQVVDKSAEAGDLAANRKFLEIVEAEAGDVDITKSEVLVSCGRGIEDEENLEIAFDLAKAMASAEAIAQKEDKLIFFGSKDNGYEGLLTASGVNKIKKSDWKEGENAFADVASAIELLATKGVFGTYSLVVSPDLYMQMQRIQPGTGLLEIDRVGKLVNGHIYRAPVLGGGKAALVCAESRNMDLVIGQDMAAAYLEQVDLNHTFRLLETVLLRIKRRQAVVLFT